MIAWCVCGTGSKYIECCGRYIDEGAIPQSAEALMRSRYAAYTMLREDYLLATWHVGKRPASLGLNKEIKENEEVATKWLGLDIKRVESQPTTAIVEFTARFKVGGRRAERLHEVSRFLFEDGRWFYVDGDLKRC